MSLVLYNPLGGNQADVPQLPATWVTIHQSATATSMTAGAITYATTHLVGSAATYTLSGGVRITGTLVAEGARLIVGDPTGDFLRSRTTGVSNVINEAGETVTQVASMVTSATAAAVVGATAFVGGVFYNLYRTYRPVKPPEVQQEVQEVADDYEFVICDIRPLSSTTPVETPVVEPSIPEAKAEPEPEPEIQPAKSIPTKSFKKK